MAEQWLHIDERTDVIASLSQCLKNLEEVEAEPAAWKWAILSLHSALQGAMVCHLSGTGNFGVLSDRSFKRTMDWHDKDRRGEIEKECLGANELGVPSYRIKNKEDLPPTEFMAPPMDLFRRLYNHKKRCEGGVGEILHITRQQCRSFRRLNGLRKEFTHFSPKGWSIEISGLPQIFLHMLEVVEMIANDPWPFRHLDDAECETLQKLVGHLRGRLLLLKAEMV